MINTPIGKRGRPVDVMPDAELIEANKAHPWSTYFTDRRGRIVGTPNSRFFSLPHPKVLKADQQFQLKGKTVVEVGALEGVHTASLCVLGAKVIAIDVREKNLAMVKTRCSLLGFSPKILKLDLETEDPPKGDIQYHVGVLYHLQDPVNHLIRLASLGKNLFLDTHYAPLKNHSYRSRGDGNLYNTYLYGEVPKNTRAGTRPFSRWLSRKDLIDILKSLYKEVKVLKDRMERHGPRIRIAAKR